MEVSIFCFNHGGIHEFEDVLVLQSGVDPHFLFYTLALIRGCLSREFYKFACCNSVVFKVDRSEDPEI
jgi:hypothetical protein